MVARLQYLRLCLFKMYVNVVFVIRCLYSAVSLTLVKEQRFIRIIYYYYYHYYYHSCCCCHYNCCRLLATVDTVAGEPSFVMDNVS